MPKVHCFTAIPDNVTHFMRAGPFPTDMLRYDCCWPASTEDAIAMSISIADSEGTKPITLCSNKPPTPKRWASFGWNITK